MADLNLIRSMMMISLCLGTVWCAQIQHVTTSAIASAAPSPPRSPCLSPSQADISTAQFEPAGLNVTIHGHVVPTVRSGRAHLKGNMSISTTLHLELVLALRHADIFTQCLDSLSDPKSPNYGHFLNATTLQPYMPTPASRDQ